MLQWSEPSNVNTPSGPALLRTAEPNGAFWNFWRVNKESCRKAGISPKNDDGKWIIRWYRNQPKPLPSRPLPLPDMPALAGAVDYTRFSKQGAEPSAARSWSKEQEAIFAWFRDGVGALEVMARAGTGKTTTIKTAFTYAKEERMLYAVFNKKNQVEAAAAITDPRVDIKTLHSVGFMFIQAVWMDAKPDSEIETERVIQVVGENAPAQARTQIRKLVGFAKNTLITPTHEELVELAEERDIECPNLELADNGGWTRERLAHSALAVLELSKQKDPRNRISFDDMVWLPVAMGWTRKWYNMVVIDEAQDMNLPQLMMAQGACKPGGRICVVGDERQAIYGFRGAATDGMKMMRETLKATTLTLTTTYRCPKKVVALAAQLVPDYRAADSAPEGEVEYIQANSIDSKVQVGDAILSRANAPLMPIALSLIRRGTPARIEGRDIGKALAGIVKDLNARSVPHFLTKLEAWEERQVSRLEKTKNFETKAAQVKDQADTLRAVAEGSASVREIITRIENIFQDTGEGSRPAVILSTTHKAKGLEWDKVFLLSSTFNRKAPVNSGESPEAAARRAQEEANVYYVALTRAKKHLVLASGEVR